MDENKRVYDRFLDVVRKRKERQEKGFVNSIPSPFQRFSSDFVGIEQGKMYLVSSFSKGAKTQFTSNVFIFNTLMYAYNHPEKVRVKYFMYLFEETPQDFIARFTSYLLFVTSGGKLTVDKDTLLSTRENKPLPDYILQMIESKKIRQYIDFFEKNTTFSSSQNATGIYNECKQYAEEHGTVHKKPKKYKDSFGMEQETMGFDYYEPNDESEYRIILVDHVSLLSAERGFNLKQSIDKLGEYCILLRDRYGFSPVIIQQQSTENESNEAIKMNKLRPTYVGLADSKYMGRNCNIMLGLFSPMRFELKDYHGYQIDKFKDKIRFCEVVLNRGGRMGGMVALYFDGASCQFKELPKPDSPEIQEWYKWLEDKQQH